MKRFPRQVCVCGCQRLCKKHSVIRPDGTRQLVKFYDKDCYTRSGERARIVVEHNKRVGYLRRMKKLGQFVDRLPRGRVTREDVVAVVMAAVGYFVALERDKWEHRLRQREKGAA